MKLQITAVTGVVIVAIEGLGDEADDAIWDAHDESGGLARCVAVNHATGYRRGLTSRSASTTPLVLEFEVDAHSAAVADGVHFRIPEHGIDISVPLGPAT